MTAHAECEITLPLTTCFILEAQMDTMGQKEQGNNEQLFPPQVSKSAQTHDYHTFVQQETNSLLCVLRKERNE